MKSAIRIILVAFLFAIPYLGQSLSVSKPSIGGTAAGDVAPQAATDSLMGAHNSPVVNTLMKITLFGSEWVLWLLLLLSVGVGAVILERIYYFSGDRIDFNAFFAELTEHLKRNDTHAAIAQCQKLHAFEARVAMEGFTSENLGLDAIEKGTSGYIVRMQTEMDRGLMFLGTLGNNAPFIGLFGTCLGIIQAFHSLSFNPAGGPSVVMGGISEALIATAVGLFVAIPAVIAFNWFQRIIQAKMANGQAVKELVLKHYAALEHRASKAA